jgi:hypothetical protein
MIPFRVPRLANKGSLHCALLIFAPRIRLAACEIVGRNFVPAACESACVSIRAFQPSLRVCSRDNQMLASDTYPITLRLVVQGLVETCAVTNNPRRHPIGSDSCQTCPGLSAQVPHSNQSRRSMSCIPPDAGHPTSTSNLASHVAHRISSSVP